MLFIDPAVLINFGVVRTNQKLRATQSWFPMIPPVRSLPAAGGGGKTHTVARGDTLYQLARTYYNDQSKWRTIYEANRGQMSSPHQLRPGQQLVIP